ncbi:hypothetical protein FCJ61_31235 [Burkholderia metallica]|uniref:hypothetical protein n=1 Tax=Burkholderia metallica TaxID=488729 RepID=UPI00157A6232|nr:hypothetical protein [Burkholderia metallica]NTZ87341.1 hypothetical protein [Burkholderia metallica]
MVTYTPDRESGKSGGCLREYRRQFGVDQLKRRMPFRKYRKNHCTKQIADLNPYRIQAGDRH